MYFNDFQILSDNDYQLLSQHYNQEEPSRNTQLTMICNEIINCKNSLQMLNIKLNSKIVYSITLANNTLSKILNNITSSFNLNIEQTTTVYNFNIFSFLYKLANIAQQLNTWSNIEQKEYYKQLSQKSSLELLDALKNIIKTMENCNVQFYKHM